MVQMTESNPTITTLIDNDDYLFQHISGGNARVAVWCQAPPSHGWVYSKDIDVYGKAFLKNNCDVLIVRAKRQIHMNDAPCYDEMKQVIDTANQYDDITGLFECGGSVLGLFYSKQIKYKKIILDSARFLDGLSVAGQEDFVFVNHRVDQSKLNVSAEYVAFYNENDAYDRGTVEWLSQTSVHLKRIPFTAPEHHHTTIVVLGAGKYFRIFLPNVLNGRY